MDKFDLLYRLSYRFTQPDVILNEFAIKDNVLARHFESLEKFVDLSIRILILHHQLHNTAVPLHNLLVLIIGRPFPFLKECVMHLNQQVPSQLLHRLEQLVY